MLVPDEHIIDPWSTPLAFAYEAIANGATVLTNHRVVSCVVGDYVTTMTTERGRRIRTRFVVNAAGLHGDALHRAFGLDGFTIRPRRGELIVFDKLARPLLNGTVLPVPTSITKGVLVAPTVFGNVMLGPTAEDLDDRTATASTRAGIDGLLETGRRILPALLDEEVTSVYAGVRAATEHTDYQISAHRDLRYVCLGGIRSTGLTSSMALAEEALTRLVDCGLGTRPKESIVDIHMTPLGERNERPYQRGGQIVCHCERVTVEEVTASEGFGGVDLEVRLSFENQSDEIGYTPAASVEVDGAVHEVFADNGGEVPAGAVAKGTVTVATSYLLLRSHKRHPKLTVALAVVAASVMTASAVRNVRSLRQIQKENRP